MFDIQPICLAVCVLFLRGGSAAIVASENDFVIDCGTDEGGPISITYDSTAASPTVPLKLSSTDNLETCSVTKDQAIAGKYTIIDVRNNCNVLKPDPTKSDYFMQLRLQEIAGIVLSTDPVFTFECRYKAGDVNVTSSSFSVSGSSVIPTSVVVESLGNPDMTYSMNILNAQGQPLTQAAIGDSVVLEVTMAATDADEVSLQVKSCSVTSGDSNLVFLQDKCLVSGLESISQLPGFMTSGTRAFLPITLFGLDGSSLTDYEFQCTASVCDTVCDGSNCAGAGKRRRRASGDESEESNKSLTLSNRIRLIPVEYSPASQTTSSTGSCTQSMGFIITVIVMGILLLVAMVIVIGLFTIRRRDAHKANP